jgi:CBS domain-containing protein
MTREVISVAPDAPIAEAARLMVEHRISGLPVVDHEGNLKGVITEGDFLRRDDEPAKRPRWLEFLIGHLPFADEFSRLHQRTVASVMTVNPATIDADASLGEAVRLIEQHDIKRLPVMHDGRMVGMIARADLVRALSHAVRRAAASGDIALRDHLVDLERQSWQRRVRT